jgi:mannose-6-phosphate isomerase-like protein (cupin superfamily)
MRRGRRIVELQIGPTQEVPWHSHSNVQDTFYVIEGELRGRPGMTEMKIALLDAFQSG